MSAKIEDFDVEIDTNMKFDSNFIKEKIPTYTSEKLCEIIVCDRYFGSFNAFAVSCMEELADRRIKGDQFEFEKYIETKAEKIEWWYKNGVSKKDFFGIKYEENDLPQTFYPDYIIQLTSGKTFIGDTKAGSTATEATSRAEALQSYIKDQNAKGKNLVGGIIIKDETKKGRVNQQDS
jgi:hypothetical protein